MIEYTVSQSTAMAEAVVDTDMTEDVTGLVIEANGVVKEIAYAVLNVQVSNDLPKDVNLVYINITTKENQDLCVELTIKGFRVSFKFQDFNLKFLLILFLSWRLKT